MIGFGEYLKKQRKKRELTQGRLAQALEVSNTYIHQLETGKIDAPNYERCRHLRRALKVEVEEPWSIARKERLEKTRNGPGSLWKGCLISSALGLTGWIWRTRRSL